MVTSIKPIKLRKQTTKGANSETEPESAGRLLLLVSRKVLEMQIPDACDGRKGTRCIGKKKLKEPTDPPFS